MRAAVLVEYNNEEIKITIRSRVEIPKKQRQWERTEKEEREKNGSVVRKEGGGQQNANN